MSLLSHLRKNGADFQLYLIEHQMAYGMGRPAILREDESIHQCRRLLEHPLSIMSDARLVSTVELTALRGEKRSIRANADKSAPLHIELTASPDLPIAEQTLRRLKQANADFDAWERYWDRVLCKLSVTFGGIITDSQPSASARTGVISSESHVSQPVSERMHADEQ